MKSLLPIFLTAIIFASCSKYDIKQESIAVKQAMENQAKCWNNGDIEGYMNGYWKSDSLRFLGKRGLTKGWQKTLENYKKSYPDKQAMGKLLFDYISFEKLNSNQMFVVGKWKLEREKDTLQGHYSLLWKKIDGDWKIIFDHTN